MSEIDRLIEALLKDNAVNSPMRNINFYVDDPRFKQYVAYFSHGDKKKITASIYLYASGLNL